MLKVKDISIKNVFDDATIDKDDIQLIDQILVDKDFSSNNDLGHIRKLEEEFKNYLKIENVYSFSKSRHALSAILDAMDLMPGDEVILQAWTCVVVVNSVLISGLKPVYCDIELETFGPDIESIKKQVTSRTKVIIAQHSYGIVCRDYQEILDFAKENNIRVIDDCAQSIGAKYDERSLGFFSSAAFYSMQHSKVISAGDGGIAVTNEEELSSKLRKIQNRSAAIDYEWARNTLYCIKRIYISNKNQILGRAFNKYYSIMNRSCPINIDEREQRGEFIDGYIKKMPQSLARLAINQLDKISKIHSKRLLVAGYYSQWAIQNNISFPIDNKRSESVFLYFPMIIDEQQINKFKQEFGLSIKIGRQNNFLSGGSSDRQPKEINLPNASIALKNLIYLPCY